MICSYQHHSLPSWLVTINFSYHHLLLLSSSVTIIFSYCHLQLPLSAVTIIYSYHHLQLPSTSVTIICSYHHLQFCHPQLPSSLVTIIARYHHRSLPSSLSNFLCNFIISSCGKLQREWQNNQRTKDEIFYFCLLGSSGGHRERRWHWVQLVEEWKIEYEYREYKEREISDNIIYRTDKMKNEVKVKLKV